MRIKTKMLKKLIAVLCAATMAASGAVASVGAIEDEEISNNSEEVFEIVENNESEDNANEEVFEIEEKAVDDSVEFNKVMLADQVAGYKDSVIKKVSEDLKKHADQLIEKKVYLE